MKKILFLCLLLFSLNWLVVRAHQASHLKTLPPPLQMTATAPTAEQGELSTVKIELDAVRNRIHFNTPYTLKNVDITVKQYGNQVILLQKNMTIQQHYSITFPKPAEGGTYTVILQQGNQIVVKRLSFGA